MIEIKRVDHIGQVVADLDKQRTLLEGLFGFKPKSAWQDGDARAVRYSVPGETGIDWEVLTPLGESSPLQPFLDSPRGPGVHHIALEVPDVGATTRQLEELGVRSQAQSGGWLDAAMDPQQKGQGLLFRLFDSTAGGLCGAGQAGSPEGAASPDGPALGIIAFDHICHAYRDRDELARFYEQALGMRETFRTPDGEHDDLADLVMDVPGTSLCWEVIQPVGDESFIQRFLDTRGPAPHHVTFQVADWDVAQAACEQAEVPTFDENQGETDGAAWRDAFIHPKYTGGMLVQLFWEERPGVWVRSDKIPSGR